MNKENLKTFLAIVTLTGFLVFSYLSLKKQREFNPFELKLNTGTLQTTLNELKKDKILLLYFGFLSCPDACPTTFNSMAGVFKELTKEELDRISFVFIDLDPERDTIEKMIKYVNFFTPKIIPVTIPLKQLDPFTKFFGIAFMKVPLKSATGYTIDHSTDILVISPKGELLEPIHHGSPKVVILSQIRKLITNQFNTEVKK